VMGDPYGTLTVRSPEGLRFSIRLAGPVTRFLAWCIDVGAIGVILMALNVTVNLLAYANVDLAYGLFIGLNFGVVLLYPIVLEWFWGGQTLGKRVMGLRVIDERGLKLHFEQVVLRNLLRVIDRMPIAYFVGGAAVTLSRRNQRLGDLAAGTIVTFTGQDDLPEIGDITGGKYNSFRNHPHLEARLRKVCPPDAAAVALEALDRRDLTDQLLERRLRHQRGLLMDDQIADRPALGQGHAAQPGAGEDQARRQAGEHGAPGEFRRRRVSRGLGRGRGHPVRRRWSSGAFRPRTARSRRMSSGYAGYVRPFAFSLRSVFLRR